MTSDVHFNDFHKHEMLVVHFPNMITFLVRYNYNPKNIWNIEITRLWSGFDNDINLLTKKHKQNMKKYKFIH